MITTTDSLNSGLLSFPFRLSAVTLVTWYSFVGRMFFKINNQDTRARFLTVDTTSFTVKLRNCTILKLSIWILFTQC